NLVGNPSVAAHNIARFGGTTWKTVGEGTDAQINDMRVFGDYLYIAGAFDHVDGIPIEDIARWDGNRWCGYNSHFDNSLAAVGMFRDTLYIGGGFWTINGDSSLRKVVRWTGGDSLYQCGNPVGISQINQGNFDFSVFPNPATSQLEIIFSENNKWQQLKIENSLGHTMKQENFFGSTSFGISDLPAGVYFLEVQNEKEKCVKKFIKE
ncbi:MAG: T9SS type A sorting domain-containing protein, partial [Chitinophagales bacterium]